MAKWSFEPGHSAAEFRARHMMVTYVRGHFKNVHGSLKFDPDNPKDSSVEAIIDAKGIWTGEPQRDDHLRSADFLDVANHPQITFSGDEVEVLGGNDFRVSGDLTIRGVRAKQRWMSITSGNGRRPGGKTASTRDQRRAPAL